MLSIELDSLRGIDDRDDLVRLGKIMIYRDVEVSVTEPET